MIYRSVNSCLMWVSTKHWPPVSWPLTAPSLLTSYKITGKLKFTQVRNYQWDHFQFSSKFSFKYQTFRRWQTSCRFSTYISFDGKCKFCLQNIRHRISGKSSSKVSVRSRKLSNENKGEIRSRVTMGRRIHQPEVTRVIHNERIAYLIVSGPTLYHHPTKNVTTLCKIKWNNNWWIA